MVLDTKLEVSVRCLSASRNLWFEHNGYFLARENRFGSHYHAAGHKSAGNCLGKEYRRGKGDPVLSPYVSHIQKSADEAARKLRNTKEDQKQVSATLLKPRGEECFWGKQ